MEITGFVLWSLSLLLPILGYGIVARRPGHTRGQLVAGSAVGGGLAGALMAAFIAAAGASFGDAMVYAVLGMLVGAVIGVAGVVAFAFGKWLKREP